MGLISNMGRFGEGKTGIKLHSRGISGKKPLGFVRIRAATAGSGGVQAAGAPSGAIHHDGGHVSTKVTGSGIFLHGSTLSRWCDDEHAFDAVF